MVGGLLPGAGQRDGSSLQVSRSRQAHKSIATGLRRKSAVKNAVLSQAMSSKTVLGAQRWS